MFKLRKWWLIFTGVILFFGTFSAQAESGVATEGNCNKFANSTQPFVLELKPGMELVESVAECVKQAKIIRAGIFGVGDLVDPTVLYFNLETKHYHYRTFVGTYEVSSMTGEIDTLATVPTLNRNIHVSLAGPNYKLVGGHLYSGWVGIIFNVIIVPLQ